jgi:O-acetyl-ADP-ribose deacetylase (regulator of RNase III)
MVKIIEGDLLKADVDIIVHQVNTQGAFGAGIAKQIANQFPESKKDYLEYCSKHNDEILGTYLLSKTDGNFDIAHLFAQIHYGKYGDFYKENNRQTNYVAFARALDQLLIDHPDKKIALPYGIGCGLAGGNWGIIAGIIEKQFMQNKKTAYLYRYNK